MRAREAHIAAAGAVLVFIGTGTPEQAAAFAREHAGDHPVLCDPSGAAFRGAGMARGLGRVIRLRTLTAALRARRAGFRQGRVQGDPWQLGGVVVLGPDGEVLHTQTDAAAGDLLDLDAALGPLAAPGD